MELKEFIGKAINDVIEGVALAQQELYKKEDTDGAMLNPTELQRKRRTLKANDQEPVQLQKIRITARVSAETQKGGGLKLNVISAGADWTKSDFQEVSFEVPVALPLSDLPDSYSEFQSQ